MSAFLRAVTPPLLAVFLIGAASGVRSISTTIDGGGAIKLPAVRGDGGTMVALEPLATRLGIPVSRDKGALKLQVNGVVISVLANDPTVRERDIPTMRLSAMPVRRDGKLFVAVDDVPSLLDVDASLRGERLMIGTKSGTTATQVAVTEVAIVKPSPPPAPSLPPRTRFQPPADKKLIGHASVTMNNDANARSYNALFDGGGRTVRANLYANGTSGVRTSIGGSARIGPGERHLTLGAVDDPLFGSIFGGGGANGIVYANGTGTVVSTVTGIQNRRAVALGRRTATSVREIAFVSGPGSPAQPLLGTQSWSDQRSGQYVQRELWAGAHGLGAALHYRSAGRLFTEAKLGFAGAGLPLVDGDAPTQATVGYELSNAFGVRAGVGSGHGQRGSGVAQIFARTRLAQFTFSRYGQQLSSNATFKTTMAQGTVGYVRGPGIASFDALGEFAVLRHGGIEGRAYLASQNSRDLAVAYRFDRDAPSATFGLESVASGRESRFGPTIGYSAPVTSSLSLGVELHPLSRGNALRFSVNQALLVGTRVPQRFVTVETAGELPDGVALLVDGVRTTALTSRSAKIAVPPGTHYLSLQSADGRIASPEQRVSDGIPTSVVLPLWPVAQIHGRVRIADTTALLGAQVPLGGIIIMLQPGNTNAQTDEDGNFTFPAQAIDPGTKIVVDATSVRNGFATPAEQSLSRAEDPVEIMLSSSKAVERVRF